MSNFWSKNAATDMVTMVLVTLSLILIGIYWPYLKFVADLVWTVPLILMTVRYGMKMGIITIGAVGLVMVFIAGPSLTFLLLLQCAGLALVYSYAFRRGLKVGVTLGCGFVIQFVLTAGLYLLATAQMGANPLDLMILSPNTIEEAMNVYREAGYFEQGVTEEAFRVAFEQLVVLIGSILPAIYALGALLTAAVNYGVAYKLLLRRGEKVLKLTQFKNWRLPWWTVWGFILGLALNLTEYFFQWKSMGTAGVNIMVFYWPFFLVLGAAVVAHWLGRLTFNASALRVGLILFGIIFWGYALVILGALGLTDLVLNLRRLPEENIV